MQNVAHRLRADVERLALPEGRRAKSAAHRRALTFLEERVREIGLVPYGPTYLMPYPPWRPELANLVAVAPGRDRGEAPVLIAAHTDTAGDQPGADDNAAAVAIALEVGTRLLARPAARDVLIALFDAEEPPYFHSDLMGSTWFATEQATGPVHAALVMDLVGHPVPLPGHGDLLFVTGMESDGDLERAILALGPRDGVRIVTALNRYVGDMSDHHVFRLRRVPYLFLTGGRWAHYHQPTDTPDRLDYGRMAAIADVLEALARGVAERPLAGPWEGYDTTPTDLETMRAGLGALLDARGIELRDRDDIERVAGLLRQHWGL